MTDRTPDPPVPHACRTGRAFVFPCCTASIREFAVDGRLWLAISVAGHGWSPPWPGGIETVNHTGTLVEADGVERRGSWQPGRGAP